LASGRLALAVEIANTVSRDTYVVTGGQIIAANAITPTGGTTNGTVAATVNTDGTKLDVNETVVATGAPITTGGAYLVIAPTVAAGGTISITRYVGVSTQYGANSNSDFKASVSVAASSAAGTVSTAKSSVYLGSPVAAGATSSYSNSYDAADGFTVNNGGAAVLHFTAVDAYGVAATGGPLTYSSDNCVVGLGGTYSTVKSNYDPTTTTGYIYASQAVANTATTCVVTIAWSGTTIGTKTIKFLGDIASINVTVNGVEAVNTTATAAQGVSGVSGNGLLSVNYKDAAGNLVTGSEPGIDSGTNATVNQLLPTWVKTTQYTIANAFGLNKSALYDWGCAGTSAGSASLVLKTTNAAGATIKSAPFTVACGLGPDSYAIATDKTTYATGEIATVTVTFKDKNGGVPNDVTAFSTINTVASGAFAGAVTGPSTSDTSTAGVIKYKYVVGQVAGTFPVVVDVPVVDAASGKAQTATITVTSTATDSVSQLVKVVGTLLTSFTKQISALIKALSTKKK